MADDSGLIVVSPDTPGVHGVSTASSGIWGESTDDVAVFGDSTNSDGVAGFATQGSGVSGSSINGSGIWGFSDNSAGVIGTSIAQPGVFGTSGRHSGVAGTSISGFGVFGSSIGEPNPAPGLGVGVWGESTNAVGVAALTKANYAFFALARGRKTAKTEPPNSANGVAGAFGGDVTIDGNLFVIGRDRNVQIDGSLNVSGNKHAVVAFPDGSHRALYSLESPESWFEDFGRARLIRGKARIRLDRGFAAVVRTGDYHIFLSPEGESRGLYVSRRGRDGFEVREQQRGTSTLWFSYRVVARRKDVIAPRFKRVVRSQLKPVQLAPARAFTLPKPPARLRRSRARKPRFLGRGGRA